MSTPEDRQPEQEEPPRGALLFILVYLLVIAIFWVNTYLRLWMRD
jgi:Cytochrome c oxidase subunit IIa family